MLSLTTLMGFLLLSGSALEVPTYAPVPVAPVFPAYLVTLTAYNAVEKQTDENPFKTASGAYSNPEIIAARSQDLAKELPFGTIIEFDGSAIQNENCGYNVVEESVGYRIIEDTMNARYTDRIDILFGTEKAYRTMDKGMKNAAEVLGICEGVTVRVVGHIGSNHSPKTQIELAALVKGGSILALK